MAAHIARENPATDTNSAVHKNLDYAIIGNCRSSALINPQGRIVWSCLPDFDSDPVFCALVNDEETAEGGYWQIDLAGFSHAEQSYDAKTAILVTTLYSAENDVLQITDFMPRYSDGTGDFKRPAVICRIAEVKSGAPRIRVKMTPRHLYGAEYATEESHDHQIDYVFRDLAYTLRTNMDLAALRCMDEITPDKPLYFIFGDQEEIESTEVDIDDLPALLSKTKQTWLDFAAMLKLPERLKDEGWRDVVVRSAITLKMCVFEPTGAIIAAMTTSIPESPDSERNWDYRYCWPRDAMFVVQTLYRLGDKKVVCDYMEYIMSLDVFEEGKDLQPLYGIRGEEKIEEWIAPALTGYKGMGPVRVGNLAYVQQQNDIWGAVLLALVPMFIDDELLQHVTQQDFIALEKFGHAAAENFDKEDAGIWEFRGFGRIHTFSAAMCWAACDALAKMAQHLKFADRAQHWEQTAAKIKDVIIARGFNTEMNSFSEPFESTQLDASLLLLGYLGVVDEKDPRFAGTVKAIGKQLEHKGLLYRYVVEDDFGLPDVAFTVCAFWYMDALAGIGEYEEARKIYEDILACRNHAGILSEDIDFDTRELWGNLPQTYSMMGLIQMALKLSLPTE